MYCTFVYASMCMHLCLYVYIYVCICIYMCGYIFTLVCIRMYISLLVRPTNCGPTNCRPTNCKEIAALHPVPCQII